MNAPDSRGWIAVGFFVLVGGMITLIALNPPLANIDGFKTTLNMITSSGLIAVAGFYFGSSKKDPPS